MPLYFYTDKNSVNKKTAVSRQITGSKNGLKERHNTVNKPKKKSRRRNIFAM